MIIIDYLADNYVLIAELIGLLLLLGISVYARKRMKIFTRLAVFLVLLSSILINIESWVSAAYDTYNVWRVVLTTVIYVVQPVILIVIMQIATPIKYKQLILLLIPVFICLILFATSQQSHLVFYFNEDNNYMGGPLSKLPYYLFGFYVIIFIIRNIIYFKNFPLFDKLSVLYIVLTSVGGVFLYLALQKTSDYSALYAYALLMYYLLLYIDMAKIDTLTGLMNRQCYYRDTESRNNRVSAVVSVDMNDLKWLNDTYGHEAGDKALLEISKCLAEKIGLKKRVYRIGGDEFMILYFNMNDAEVSKDVERMRALIGKTPYVCAFGQAAVAKDESIEETVHRADKAMYEDKARLKREVLEKGGTLHRRYDDM